MALSSAGTKHVAYSTDGINWTESTLPIQGQWTSVCYGNDKFVAVATNSDKAVYSTDGITWTECELPSVQSWTSVYYGNGKYNQDLTSKALLFEMGCHKIEKEYVIWLLIWSVIAVSACTFVYASVMP